ncbi:TPA: hypothetical protein HA235_03660 [Candidatus Woesearchaeota archaeon]|nr:COG1361 S-layer family protein [Candidatus Woesearchaeota archaeon]HIH31778.1 hypothetical protein [Candidatus Woesearchaeota archaeon]HIH54661.1 hypothetical protein [Candidatus Woesearchaeota archaeon]HIJ01548.1 hypothetical protein [Candidatus Woesearchaeota archaeon]HIJ13951.1 hypothetical protein [Candidatus Woesearchaeota archaeon]
MKKIYYGIFVLLALVTMPSALSAPSLQVSLSKYEPYPASPGDTVKVWLLVQNTASSDATDIAKNVIVELLPEYPFSLYGDSTTKIIGQLGAKKDYLIDFTLKVDEKALQGNNIFKVRVKDSGSSVQIEQELTVFVQSRDTTISIESVSTEPEQIAPGSDGKIKITVKNLAPTTFKDLTLKLYLQSIVGSTLVDLPFAPIDSSAEKRIFRLDPGQSAEFSFDLRAYPDAIAKIYKIPFALEYYDNLGNKKNKSDFIGVTVNSRPEVTLTLDKTDINQKKTTGTITLKVINKGLGDIKFLNVILKASDNYEILSTTDTTYVGNLESDDYQSVDYKIAVKSDLEKINIPVTLQYRDANNKYYEMNIDVPMNILSAAKANGSNGSNLGTIIFVIIIVVIIAGIVIYRKTKKNKKGMY